MRKLFFIFLLLSAQFMAQASEPSQIIQSEWQESRELVSTLKADGDVGGYMLYKDYSDMKLLWRTNDQQDENEVIRFFRLRASGTVFSVTYHKSDVIIPGRTVIRRFIGTEPTGWVNHTVDFHSGEYLGQQGFAPNLTREEENILHDWAIENF
jgi:hypothetical protein